MESPFMQLQPIGQLGSKGNSDGEMEMVLLQTSYTNLTKERDQLQTSYTNLTKERDQLQTSYTNLTKERDQLQKTLPKRKRSLERPSRQVSCCCVFQKEEKLYRLVVVSVGLLCILQAAANIGLRLSLCDSSAGMPDFEAIIKNLTEEGEDLKRKLSTFDRYSQEGWVYLHPSFYYISSSEKSWQESRDDCLQRGADLMIINSKEEQEFARQFKRLTWIGFTDRETEGIWKWVDGTALETSYWHNGEPNSYQSKEEDCGEIKYYEEENSWNDEPCNNKNFWICEKVMAQ
ncbi:uncharacterized protein PEZ65_003706 [Lycodopsis pacificus]